MTPALARLLPGALVAAAGVASSYAAHAVVPDVGTLTWAVLLGALAANTGLVPTGGEAGLTWTRGPVLKVGVALLGFSLSVGALASLGLPLVLAVVVGTALTYVLTAALGRSLGLSRPRAALLAAGTAVCGASAVAALEEPAGAQEEDVALAVGLITLLGTVGFLALPYLQGPLGLDDRATGAWIGAGLHEVGQVVAGAGAVGGAALTTAVLVKLVRVLCLAPLVTVVTVQRRRAGDGSSGRTPWVPGFVVGFAVCVALTSLGLVPTALEPALSLAQTVLLAAGLFGVGTAVTWRKVAAGSGPALLTGVVGSLGLLLWSWAAVVLLL